ncbi:MAG TPA: alpha/beta fold hydrolase [Chryseosolibacter sp.]|nr:alpha/beta fold hydrolase [Chryseosolibacter sp.]
MLRAVRWTFPKVEKVAPFLAHRYFVKIFFTPLRYRVPEKEQVIEKTAEKFHVFVAKKKVQCYSWGSGPVVLLAHGWAGRATQFRKFIEALTTHGYRVVGFDGPAHGQSDGKSTNVVEFEVAFKRIYEVVGEPEAIICHSFGGGAALFSGMHGLRIKKLINIASPTIADEIIRTYLRAINGSWETGKFFKKYILKSYGKSFEEFTALHFISNLTQQIDILLVHDEDDEEVTLDHAKELIRRYPQAQLFQTKGLGHTRILKDDAVISRVVTFIREIRQ